jgi:hypothetical protein
MSIDIWPPISPEELKIKQVEAEVSSEFELSSFSYHQQNTSAALFQTDKMLIDPKTGRKKRELSWMIGEIRETITDLKHGLEDCYALLAPIDPGSTLVMSTPRNEKVKGHITRVGTRIVKGVRNCSQFSSLST